MKKTIYTLAFLATSFASFAQSTKELTILDKVNKAKETAANTTTTDSVKTKTLNDLKQKIKDLKVTDSKTESKATNLKEKLGALKTSEVSGNSSATATKAGDKVAALKTKIETLKSAAAAKDSTKNNTPTDVAKILEEVDNIKLVSDSETKISKVSNISTTVKEVNTLLDDKLDLSTSQKLKVTTALTQYLGNTNSIASVSDKAAYASKLSGFKDTALTKIKSALGTTKYASFLSLLGTDATSSGTTTTETTTTSNTTDLSNTALNVLSSLLK